MLCCMHYAHALTRFNNADWVQSSVLNYWDNAETPAECRALLILIAPDEGIVGLIGPRGQ